MGEFLDVFFGTPQSLYASYAIIAAIITICITIMLTGTEIPFANRFLFIFLTILMLIPSVFLILFQITCMVTGGTKDTRWWCWLYAWIVSAFIIVYCIFVIIISFSSLFTYTNAMTKIEIQDSTNKNSPEISNAYAKNMMIENFENQEPGNILISDSGKIINSDKYERAKVDKFMDISKIREEYSKQSDDSVILDKTSEKPKMTEENVEQVKQTPVLKDKITTLVRSEYPAPLSKELINNIPVPKPIDKQVNHIGTPKEEKKIGNKQVTIDNNGPYTSNDEDGFLNKFIGNYQIDEQFIDNGVEAFTNMDNKYSSF